jgi:hypothetical protein
LIGIYLKHGREKKSTKGLLVFTPTQPISYHIIISSSHPIPSPPDLFSPNPFFIITPLIIIIIIIIIIRVPPSPLNY